MLAAFGSSYESLVTEATRPTRLFKGPRNKNRTGYGTNPLAHDRGRAPLERIGSFWTTAKNTAIPDSSPTAVLGDRPETFNLAHEEEGRPESTALYP